MLNPEMFLKINGKKLRHIIEGRHAVLGRRIDEAGEDQEKKTSSIGYNNTLKVLDTEIDKIPFDATVYITEDTAAYEINVSVYLILRQAKTILNMYYVKVTECQDPKGNRFFIIYFAEL